MSALRWLQVGVGSVGRRRLRVALADSRIEVVGAVDSAAAGRAAATDLGVAWVGEDLSRALTELQPDVVVVSTPHAQHVAHVRAALAAGADVLCEKPLGAAAGDVRALAEAATGRKLAMARNHLHLPSVAEALRRFRAGVIGELTTVRVAVGHNRAASLPAWHRDAAHAGGGCLRDNGAHALLICEALWAHVGDTPVRVSTSHTEVVADGDVEAVLRGEVHSSAGRRLALDVSWLLDTGYRFEVELEGQDGELRVEGPVGLKQRVGAAEWEAIAVEDGGPMASWQRDTEDFVAWVLDATLEESPARSSLAAARWSAEVTDALYRSAASGEPAAVASLS